METTMALRKMNEARNKKLKKIVIKHQKSKEEESKDKVQKCSKFEETVTDVSLKDRVAMLMKERLKVMNP